MTKPENIGLSDKTFDLLKQAKLLSKVRGGDQDERKKLIEQVVEVIRKELELNENS